MAFFTLGGVLRRFPAAAYIKYASPQTLVRPCPAKKILIYELDTQLCHLLFVDGHYLILPGKGEDFEKSICVVLFEKPDTVVKKLGNFLLIRPLESSTPLLDEI